MNEPIQSKNRNKKLAKTYTADEARRIVFEMFRDSSDPEHIFRDIADNLLPGIIHGTPQESERAKNWLLGKSDEAQMTMGLEHHYPLLDTIDRRYAALVLSIVRQLEREYDCKTALEKMLAEQITIAHIKIIAHSAIYQDWLGVAGRSGSSIKAQELEALSRQVDRAQRQLISALITLRQIKCPQLEVNIINRNTFVAKNQQINATPLKP